MATMGVRLTDPEGTAGSGQPGEDDETDVLAFYARHYRHGIIDLSSSSPPAGALQELPATLSEEALGYVPPTGAPQLRSRIAALYESLSADDIVLASGASEVLAALAHALLRPGDTATVERGAYSSFIAAARRVGAQVAWHDAPEARMAVLCNPTVPAGMLLESLPAATADRPVVVDECHLDIVYGEQRPRRAADLSPHHVSVGGLSKNLGLSGVRVGWLGSRDADIRRRFDREVQLLSGGPAGVSVDAAACAFDGYHERLPELRAAAAANACAVYAVLDAMGWRYRPAEAGLTVEAWPPAPVSPSREQALCSIGYFLVPCSVYGNPGAYRVSLFAAPEALRTALPVLSPGR